MQSPTRATLRAAAVLEDESGARVLAYAEVVHHPVGATQADVERVRRGLFDLLDWIDYRGPVRGALQTEVR